MADSASNPSECAPAVLALATPQYVVAAVASPADCRRLPCPSPPPQEASPGSNRLPRTPASADSGDGCCWLMPSAKTRPQRDGGGVVSHAAFRQSVWGCAPVLHQPCTRLSGGRCRVLCGSAAHMVMWVSCRPGTERSRAHNAHVGRLPCPLTYRPSPGRAGRAGCG